MANRSAFETLQNFAITQALTGDTKLEKRVIQQQKPFKQRQDRVVILSELACGNVYHKRSRTYAFGMDDFLGGVIHMNDAAKIITLHTECPNRISIFNTVLIAYDT